MTAESIDSTPYRRPSTPKLSFLRGQLERTRASVFELEPFGNSRAAIYEALGPLWQSAVSSEPEGPA